MKYVPEKLAIAWQLPAGLLSFALHRILRAGLRMLARTRRQTRIRSGQAYRWYGLSQLLKQPLMLPYIMVTGPRWNCHAVIATLGPFPVRHSIDLRVADARRSARNWTIVVYDSKHRTFACISENLIPDGRKWEKLEIPPGEYHLALRYYQCDGEIWFPAAVIDGSRTVPSEKGEWEKENYAYLLNRIRSRRPLLFSLIHAYVFYLLRWKALFKIDFVKKEYVPVGNPDTQFDYGALYKGERLTRVFDKQFLEKNKVFLTYYNKSSFPVFWCRITTANYESAPVPCDGHYLFRYQACAESCLREAETEKGQKGFIQKKGSKASKQIRGHR